MPKLCRQKRNRSSEDSWSKGKLRIIDSPLKSRKGGTRSAKSTCTGEETRNNKPALFRACDDQPSIQRFSSMEKHFKLLFSGRKMWRWLLRIACALPNISLTLKSKTSCNCYFEALNLTASHVSLSRVWQVSPEGYAGDHWLVRWLVKAQRPVFGWLKLAPIKEKSFVRRVLIKQDEGLFRKPKSLQAPSDLVETNDILLTVKQNFNIFNLWYKFFGRQVILSPASCYHKQIFIKFRYFG